MATWREYFRPIIAKVIADNGTDDQKRLKKALRDAWPTDMGERKFHPYKIWLDEIKRQLGSKSETSRINFTKAKWLLDEIHKKDIEILGPNEKKILAEVSKYFESLLPGVSSSLFPAGLARTLLSIYKRFYAKTDQSNERG